MSRTHYHMPPEEFRKWGHALIDWIAEYQSHVERLPVLAPVAPGEVRAKLPPEPPQQGEPFDRILGDIDRIIVPGLTHWQSPTFFGFFPANTSGPSILGELLAAGLGVQGMMWATSPACTELETHVLDWVADMLGLPAQFKSSGPGGGVIQDSASSAVLCALLAARERATGFAANESGPPGTLTAYASTQAHSSLEKAVKIAGIGRRQLRLLEPGEQFRLTPGALQDRIHQDLAAGFTPFFVSATVGTTSSNGLDPLREIGEIARRHKLWLHVDAAMSGTAAVCPEFRHIHDGLEWADSYCFNPHKWMFTNFDCDCFFVADRNALVRALSVLPEYLKNKATESGAVIDYRDWQVPLGRRFRSLKLWFTIRHYGVEGLRHHVRQHVRMAQDFAGWVSHSRDFQLVVEPPLNLVCFAHRAGDDFNRRLLDRVNQCGKIYLTHTVLGGKFVLRLSVGQTYTEPRHVKLAWETIQAAASELEQSG